MKSKDLFRLAKISLAARKKSTRSTVRGIAFGLILLIPVLYIAFGIFGDLGKKVNANPEILYMNLSTAAARSGQADDAETQSNWFDQNSAVFSSSHADSLAKNVKSGEVFQYEQIYAPFNPYLVDKSNGKTESFEFYNSRKAFTMTYGGTEKEVYVFSSRNNQNYGPDRPAYSDSSLSVPFAAVVDGTEFCPSKTSDKFGDIYAFGGGFTGDGKGQAVLSETFIKSLDLNVADFADKTFSVRYTDSPDNSQNNGGGRAYIDNDNDPSNDEGYDDYNNKYKGIEKDIYFCRDFKVVGVIKDEVTRFAMDTYGSGGSYADSPDHIMTNMMFFTSASQYYGDGEVLEPVITKVAEPKDEDSENNYERSYFVATYTQSDNEFELLNGEYMAFGANSFTSLKYITRYSDGSSENLVPFPTRKVLVEAKKFDELDAAVTVLKADFSALLGDAVSQLTSMAAGLIYTQIKLVNSVFTYVVIGLSVVGGIIFFASMVNLFNSIVHSVDSRKNYLGVLRAVGAKRSLINKMYMAESLTIFKRALIWILIFATAVCVGIKFLLDLLFEQMNALPIMPFKMSVSFAYIPVALGVALAVLLLLGFAFSYGCSWKVSRDPITKTLSA